MTAGAVAQAAAAESMQLMSRSFLNWDGLSYHLLLNSILIIKNPCNIIICNSIFIIHFMLQTNELRLQADTKLRWSMT